MTAHRFKPGLAASVRNRRSVIAAVAALALLLTAVGYGGAAFAQSAQTVPAASRAAPPADADDRLTSWNDGPAKAAIIDFVRATTDPASPDFVAPEDRIATFDLDGTLWVSHPMYTQVVYALDRVPEAVKRKPGLADVEPFKTVLSGDRAAIDKLLFKDLQAIFEASFTGLSVEALHNDAVKWLETARHPRWQRPYTELAYKPMQDLINYLRAKGFRTYIVTGSGQDFVRVFAERVYGIPPEQVIGSADATTYRYRGDGKPELIVERKVLLDDDFAGKPEGIHLIIGRRPTAAFGNSTGDRQMLEYAKAGRGRRLSMIVLHDDGVREYAYGPAEHLPDTKVGNFPQSLYAEAKKQGWVVISIKNDWNRVFAFE